jgi:hypothetical protein
MPAQRQEPFDLEVSQLWTPDSIFADLDMSQIDAYIDQYIGQGLAGTNSSLSSREVDDASYDKYQYRYNEMPGPHLPMSESYGTAMSYQDVELGAGT